jgi:hypothetical protein
VSAISKEGVCYDLGVHYMVWCGQGHCHLGNDKVYRQSDGLRRAKDDYQGCRDAIFHSTYITINLT